MRVDRKHAERWIYSLEGPDGVVRYVGVTGDPERRLHQHRVSSPTSAFTKWLHSMRLEREFLAFHAANPHVLDLVIREALRAKAAGNTDGGIALVWERLRWLLTVETRAADGFKLNNNHRAYFSRLAMHVEPRLVGFFETLRQEHAFDPATVPVLRRSA